MDSIKIQELQELISKQKQLAGLNFFGAFKDGFLAALDIVNSYLKLKEPKCEDCQIELSEEEISDGDGVCNKCYERLQAEHHAESSRDR